MIFGIYLFVMILMVGGIGIDLMRYERDRTNLQNTLDRAVLSAADLDQRLDPEAVVLDYFAKSGMADELSSVNVDEAIGSRTVTATATKTINTFFMHMSGIDTLTTPAAGTANETIPNIEISFVLDISGSMRFNSRMTELRPAARSFVTQVLNTSAPTNVSINIVPYAGQVNPGPEMFDYLGGQRFGQSGGDFFTPPAEDVSEVTLWFDTDASGTLDADDFSARFHNFPADDVAHFDRNDMDEYYDYAVDYVARRNPGFVSADNAVGAVVKSGDSENFVQVSSGASIAAPASDVDEEDGPDLSVDFDDFYAEVVPNNLASCLEMTASDFTSTGLPVGSTEQSAHFMKWTIAADVMDWGWCPQNDTAIIYAQNDETALHTFIDTMRMHDGTGTFYGMKYALALLDPGTRPAISHLADLGLVPEDNRNRPVAWSDPETAKYVVLMTDGQITDQFRPVNTLAPENMDEELNNRPSGDGYRKTSRSTNLSRFYALCDMAKDNGVVIYTIAFDAPSGASNEMKRCASSDSHFFRVGVDEIDDAFSAIAASISKLRLTQ